MAYYSTPTKRDIRGTVIGLPRVSRLFKKVFRKGKDTKKATVSLEKGRNVKFLKEKK